ncbi:MAG: DUF1800 domain-containing protein, partial [Pseudomonadota bacterium]
MRFDPLTAVTRFGGGPSPLHALPTAASDMLDEARADPFAGTHPFTTTDDFVASEALLAELRSARRNSRGTPEREANDEAFAEARRNAQARANDDLKHSFLRQAGLAYGLRERLVAFWSDHFAAGGRGGAADRLAALTLTSDAIRPHVMGSFTEMLRAVVRHPVMLRYLDQVRSMGPNSRVGRRRDNAGLNENLARELLELHTLGVGGPYDQRDVRELAELLTGLTVERGEGFIFREDFVEPGAEEVLGQTYGGRGKPGGLVPIDAVLDDLARHPATADHIARKLAVHFVSDSPDPALVAHVAARFRETGGDLAEVAAALLEHPGAWDLPRRNVKWPALYIASSLRALGLGAAEVAALDPRRVHQLIRRPLEGMGQPWTEPPDPAGFEEADPSWITPQAVAARINWAMRSPARLTDALPDPREMLRLVAGDRAPGELTFAVGAAEDRKVGV